MPMSLAFTFLLGTVWFTATPLPAPVPDAPLPGAAHTQEDRAPSAAPLGGRVIRVSEGVMAGLNLTQMQPVYPPEAKAQHISGFVVMAAVIDAAGLVRDLHVISGPEVLRASALEAVRQWTYKPYLLNGQPTAIHTTVTVNFPAGTSH